MEKEWHSIIEAASVSLLSSWGVWLGDDELRAIHILVDAPNGRMEISLLTDREPYLADGQAYFEDGAWLVGDWRLSDITATDTSSWPDAEPALRWLAGRSKSASQSDRQVERDTIDFMLAIFTGHAIAERVGSFRRTTKPVRVQVALPDGSALNGDLLPHTVSIAAKEAHAAGARRLSSVMANVLKLERSGNLAGAAFELQQFLGQSPPVPVAAIAQRQLLRLNALIDSE
jgi:hypothetical protein